MATCPVLADGAPRQLELDPASGTVRLTCDSEVVGQFELKTVAFIRQLALSSDDTQAIEIVRLDGPIKTGEGGTQPNWPSPSVISLALPPASNLLDQPQIKPLLLPSPTSARTLSIISNAFAGARRAPQALDRLVRPLLDAAGVGYAVHETQSEGDAGTIAARLIEAGAQTVLLAGGDGTVGEVVNGLLLGEDGQLSELGAKVGLVLVPLGTANALYHHLFPPETAAYALDSPLALLHSLLAYLRSDSQTSPSPLPLALNTLHAANSGSSASPASTCTTVVTSAALHAAILHDAEALRHSHPGVERFKIAAHQNASTWWSGTLRLLGSPSIYSPATKSWEALPEHARALSGPYSYFVSSLVSRFETNFVVAPLRSPIHSLARTGPSLDLVLIRPLRRPDTRRAWEAAGADKAKQEAVRTEFVAKVWEVTGGMYDGGKHVDSLYSKDGEGENVSVVEYIRCEGFEWQPDPSDDVKSNIVCLDGAVKGLGRGGEILTKALGAEFGIEIWA